MSELIHVTATHEQLLDEALRLSEHKAQTYLTIERRQQLQREMNHVLFEIQCRDGAVLLGGDHEGIPVPKVAS